MPGISSKDSSSIPQSKAPHAASSSNLEAANEVKQPKHDNTLDAFGFPIGTHDSQGRKYGQLDDLYTERDKLNSALAAYEQRREALDKEKYAVPLTQSTQSTQSTNASDTLKQEIETRALLIAITQLITENDATIKSTEDLINVNNASIKRKESQYETLKKDRESVSKGGRRYKNKIAYAKVAVIDEGHKKNTAEVTLIRNPSDHDAEVMLSCANQNIDKWSNIEATLDAERQRLDDLMKIYRV